MTTLESTLITIFIYLVGLCVTFLVVGLRGRYLVDRNPSVEAFDWQVAAIVFSVLSWGGLVLFCIYLGVAVFYKWMINLVNIDGQKPRRRHS